MKPADKIQPYKKEFKHSHTRRKKGHDYCAPCRYHITIMKDASCPPFSSLEIINLAFDGIKVNLSPIGEIIDEEIRNFQNHHPRIFVREHIVMPDHIHIFIDVIMRLGKPVGSAIGGLKIGIANRWRAMTGDMNSRVFEDGFNDRIVFFFRGLDTISDYIRHNPYRLAVRMRRPSFFQNARNIFFNKREIQGYGNFFHLRNPFKYPLIIHRADSDADFLRKRDECLYYAENGGVVVSPFISAREKEIRKAVEASGGRIILIRDYPFIDREKPAKQDFNLCCEGRLLVLSPLDYLKEPKSEHPSRARCLDMNSLAEAICK